MAKKRKAPAAIDYGDVEEGDAAPRGPKRVRNRASPAAVVKLYPHLVESQKKAVTDMEFDSMLNILCITLHTPVINWLGPLYDKHSREFVIPGRGRIPLNEDLVFRCLGLPYGTEPVPYHVDRDLQDSLGPILFPADGIAPLTTRVFEILKDMKNDSKEFKQIFVMYIVSTILAPTTRNHVNNRCYPIVANIENVHKMQWCKFVADRLHNELCSGKELDKECLFLIQLLYVDSLDISGLGITLPRGRYAVTIWSKEDICNVLKADLQHDGKSYGRLELKPQFGFNYRAFGGAEGFSRWFDTVAHPSCPAEQKAQIGHMLGKFATGLVGIMGTLVYDWTSLQGNAGAEMAHQFAANIGGQFGVQIDDGIVMGGASSSAAAGGRVTRAAKRARTAAHTRVEPSPALPSLPHDNTLLDDSDGSSSDNDAPLGPFTDSSEDNADQYVRATRDGKQVEEDDSVGDDDRVLSLTYPTQRQGNSSEQKSLAGDESSPSEGMSPVSERMSPLADQRSPPVDPVDIDQGSKEPAATVLAGARPLHVYKASGKGKRKRLQKVGLVDNSIKSVVVDALGLTATMMRSAMANPNVTDVCASQKEVPKSKKKIPVRKQMPKQPTRASPRLAKLRSAASVTNLGASTSVIDVDDCSPVLSPPRDQDAVADEVVGDAPLSPADERPQADEAVGADHVPMGGPASDELVASAAAAPAADPAPMGDTSDDPVASAAAAPAAAASVAGSSGAPIAAILTDDVTTTAARVAGAASKAKEFVRASTLFIGIPGAAPVILSQEDASIDEENANEPPGVEASGEGGRVYNNLEDMDDPVWNFSSQSPAAPAPSVGAVSPAVPVAASPAAPAPSVGAASPAVPEASFLGVEAPGDIPSGIPVTAPGDLFHLFEPEFVAPLSFAPPTSTIVASDKGKMPLKGEKSVISLDDLVAEKFGAEGTSRFGEVDHQVNQISASVQEVHVDSTPGISVAVPINIPDSVTPATRLRTVRLKNPSKALLPPFSYIIPSAEEVALYKKVIIHTKDEHRSRIRNSMILCIDPMWVYTHDLADSVRPDGELSNNMCDLAISVLQDTCPPNKVIFSYLVTKYLMEGNFKATLVQRAFRRDKKYILSHKDLLSFPVLQTLGTAEHPMGHWYMLSVNLPAKRFEILDSLRGEANVEMINHANKLVEAIKRMYRVNYSDSRRQIEDWELMYIPGPKQNNGTDCGFFMLKNLELWNGSVVPAISQDQMPGLKIKLTSLWLSYWRNDLKNWEELLDENVF